MSQCLHITFTSQKNYSALQETILKKARSLGIEGFAQANTANNTVKVIACGAKNSLEKFVDFLHQESSKDALSDISIEPTLKERDFRGVFRVIE